MSNLHLSTPLMSAKKLQDYAMEKGEISFAEIYRAKSVIADAYLSGDTALVIKTYNPSGGVVYTKNIRSEVLGYKVIIDTTASGDEFKHIPGGRK